MCAHALPTRSCVAHVGGVLKCAVVCYRNLRKGCACEGAGLLYEYAPGLHLPYWRHGRLDVLGWWEIIRADMAVGDLACEATPFPKGRIRAAHAYSYTN